MKEPAVPDTADAGPLRVGRIDFLNCLPLTWGLERIGADARHRFVAATPDVLSDALIAGELDAGPISLVEALRHADRLRVMPEAAVGSDGPVGSVCLVVRGALGDLDGRTVALGSTSRTSVLLARLLLERRHGLRPTYRTQAPDLDRMLAGADAAVLIGDPALRATVELAHHPDLTVVDLGQAWKEWTGLPMVFAVWAVRAEVAAERPEQVEELRRDHAEALALAAEHRADVVAAAATLSGLAPEALAAYYRLLDFRFQGRQQAGVERFAAELAALDGPGVAELQVLPPL